MESDEENGNIQKHACSVVNSAVQSEDQVVLNDDEGPRSDIDARLEEQCLDDKQGAKPAMQDSLEENWDKNSKSQMHCRTDFSVQTKENWNSNTGIEDEEENWDDDVVWKPVTVIPDFSKFNELAHHEFESSLNEPNAEPCSEASVSSDCRSFVVGKYRHRKPKRDYIFVNDAKKIFVTNIGFKTSQKVLWDFFKRFGDVKQCQLLLNSNGQSSGRAIVTFCDESGTQATLSATEKEEIKLHGRSLQVSVYRKKVFQSQKSSEDNEQKQHENSLQDSAASIGADDSEQKMSDTSCDVDVVSDAPIDKLPDEVMIYILTFLTLQERLLSEGVCRRWRHLSLVSWPSIKRLKLWTGLSSARCIVDQDVKVLLKRGSNSLVSLDLSSSSSRLLTDHSLSAIAKYCENIKELNISGMNITNKGLKTLADGCCGLQSITICDRFQQIGEKGLWWIFHRCKKLRHVDLNGNHLLKGQCLHVLGPDITHLELGNCNKLIDIGIQKVRDRCPKLQELSINSCYRLTDKAFQLLGECLTITSLDISKPGEAVTSNGLMELCHLKHLEHLTALECPILNDAVLVAISQACHQLRTVLIQCSWISEERITDVGIESVCANCPLLSVLNIGNNSKISNSSLRTLSPLENLKELVVSHSNHITDEGVQCLLTGCPQLQVLGLRACPYVSNASVLAAISRMEVNALQSLTLTLDLEGTSVKFPEFPDLPSNLKLFRFAPFEYPDDDVTSYGVDLCGDDDELNFKFALMEDEYDEFLENDDPLEDERWEVS